MSVAKLTLADGTRNVELTKDAAGWQALSVTCALPTPRKLTTW